MTTGYRGAALSCPVCAEHLEAVPAGDAVVDVCKACSGIWIDWFDGDLAEVTRKSPRLEGALVGRGEGSRACPRCRRALDVELYFETEAVILRCGDCVGAFVPQGSIQAILDRKASPQENPDKGGFIERLLDTLRGLVK